MYVVSFIKSSNVESVRQTWEKVATNLVKHAGIDSIHLYQVTSGAKEENPVDFQFVSVIECQDHTRYKVAKNNILPELKNSSLEKSEDKNLVIEKEVFAETYYSKGMFQFNTHKTILISPATIPNEQTIDFLAHWFSACKVMLTKEGFVGVNFLKVLGPETTQVKYINIAIWESPEYLKKALISDDYMIHRESAMQFRNGLAPAFCKHIGMRVNVKNLDVEKV